jgi:trimethylamine--corrinoid protein Co-methyltransferase
MEKIQPIEAKIKLEVLTPEELRQIKSATLQILAETGVRFPSEKALQVFAEHGGQVDWERQVVQLSPDLVLKTLQDAPRNYLLASRSGQTDLFLDGRHSFYATDGCGTRTLDLKTGIERPSNKDDVAMMARVSDFLSSIAFYWPMVSAQEYGKIAPLHELDASFNNIGKHVQTETVMGADLAEYAMRMGEALTGSIENLRQRPVFSSMVCTIAPLSQDKEGIEAAMVFAEAGVPIGFMAMPTMGSTAPAVPGGALTVGNAEVVSAMVLMQMVRPGAPVFESILVSFMDPRSADYIVSTSEKFLCNAAAIQMAHDWGVPSLGGTFGVDCPEPASWQLGRDSVYTALMCALAGTDITIGLGMLEASTLLIPEQIIFDDEIYHTNRIVSQGLDISAEGLGLEVIQAIGPGGHYLAQKHTRQFIRERWIPELSHPRPSQNGAPLPDIRARARAKFDQILAEHQPPDLDEHIQSELNSILQAAEKQIGM